MLLEAAGNEIESPKRLQDEHKGYHRNDRNECAGDGHRIENGLAAPPPGQPRPAPGRPTYAPGRPSHAPTHAAPSPARHTTHTARPPPRSTRATHPTRRATRAQQQNTQPCQTAKGGKTRSSTPGTTPTPHHRDDHAALIKPPRRSRPKQLLNSYPARTTNPPTRPVLGSTTAPPGHQPNWNPANKPAE